MNPQSPQDMQIPWADSYALQERERLEAPDPERHLLERESFEIVVIRILRFYRKYCPARGAIIILILHMLVVCGMSVAQIAEALGLERDCVLRLAEEGEEIVSDSMTQGEKQKEGFTADDGYLN